MPVNAERLAKLAELGDVTAIAVVERVLLRSGDAVALLELAIRQGSLKRAALLQALAEPGTAADIKRELGHRKGRRYFRTFTSTAIRDALNKAARRGLLNRTTTERGVVYSSPLPQD